MCANVFTTFSMGKDAEDAFFNAVDQAKYDYGHSGYTGTIAEKYSFVMIDLPEGKEANDYAEELIENEDSRINDKWGPAGCFKISDNEYYFFGWGSS